MATTKLRFVLEQLPATTTNVFTVPALHTYQIVSAVGANLDTANATQIAIEVNSGGGLTDYLTARTIPAKGTDLLPELVGMIFEAGDLLNAFASAVSDINLKVSVLDTV